MLLSYNAFERARQLKNPCPDRTLVIIDMQDHFIATHEEELISIICKLITHAKQHKWAIIILEYGSFGTTTCDILEAVKDYSHIETVTKNDCDGGKEIIDCITRNPSWSLNLLVCGLYGDACVPATVAGLFNASDLVEIDVITDAISPGYYRSSKEDEHDQQQEAEVTTNDILTTQGVIV